ncbi:MAG: hydroxymethylglutaryl-CoA synthase [Pseudomonadota bacterium]
MDAVGIEALNVYAGVAVIDVHDLFVGRGLEVARIDNIQQSQRSIGLGFEDPVTNAVNAAHPIIERLTPEELVKIEMVIVSTESGVDYSKSISSYVHKYLNLPNTCRFLEVKQACYAATGALQMALGYIASGMSPGAKALVIATDVSLVDARAEYAEPSTGFGAAAILISDNPQILRVDYGAFGVHAYETMDSARPLPSADIADVDKSLFAYLDCLTNSFNNYKQRVDGVDIVKSFGQLCMHTPFAGLVQAAHRKIMRQENIIDANFVAEDFNKRVEPSLVYPKKVGNLCSGSIYLALASVLDNSPLDEPTRVGLFSYGSGCSSEFYSGVMTKHSKEVASSYQLKQSLARRTKLSFQQYEELLPDNLQSIVPQVSRQINISTYEKFLPAGRPKLLALSNIQDYYRSYEWI